MRIIKIEIISERMMMGGKAVMTGWFGEVGKDIGV